MSTQRNPGPGQNRSRPLVADPDQNLTLESDAECGELFADLQGSKDYLAKLVQRAADDTDQTETGKDPNEQPGSGPMQLGPPLYGQGMLPPGRSLPKTPAGASSRPPRPPPSTQEPVNPSHQGPRPVTGVHQLSSHEGVAESSGPRSVSQQDDPVYEVVPAGFPGAGVILPIGKRLDFELIAEWLRIAPLQDKQSLTRVSAQEITALGKRVYLTAGETVMIRLCAMYFVQMPPCPLNSQAAELLFGVHNEMRNRRFQISSEAMDLKKLLDTSTFHPYVVVVSKFFFTDDMPYYETYASVPSEVFPKETMNILHSHCPDVYVIVNTLCHFTHSGASLFAEMPEFLSWYEHVVLYLDIIGRGSEPAHALLWDVAPKDYRPGSTVYQPPVFAKAAPSAPAQDVQDTAMIEAQKKHEERVQRLAGYVGQPRVSAPVAIPRQQQSFGAFMQMAPPANTDVTLRDTSRFSDHSGSIAALKASVAEHQEHIKELQAIVKKLQSDLATAVNDVNQVKLLLNTVNTQAAKSDLSARQIHNQSFFQSAPPISMPAPPPQTQYYGSGQASTPVFYPAPAAMGQGYNQPSIDSMIDAVLSNDAVQIGSQLPAMHNLLLQHGYVGMAAKANAVDMKSAMNRVGIVTALRAIKRKVEA